MALLVFGLAGAVMRPAIWGIPILVAASVILAGMDWHTLNRMLSDLKVRRRLPSGVVRDAPFEMTLALEHPGAGPLAAEIRGLLPEAANPPLYKDKFRLSPAGATERRLVLCIPLRGRHKFGPVFLRLTGRFGFLERSKRFDLADEIRVLPEGAVSDVELRKQALDDRRFLGLLTRSRLRGEGLEFESLSEFRTGDDPRRIDWRATARHRHLIARRFQLEQHRDVMIVIDCGRLMGADAERGTKLDRAVDSTLLLSRVAIEKGDRCGLAYYDDDVRGYLPPLVGNGAYRILVDSVFDLQSEWKESNFARVFAALQARQRKRALIVILSDLVDCETSERFRSAVAALARRHIILFVALQTPALSQILASPTDTVVDASRKAVVLRLLREREKAIASLRNSGVLALDIEPDQLTVPLVNRYIEIRERNLL